MNGYLEKGKRYNSRFWQAMTRTNKCDACGWQLNGVTFLPDLLERPVDVTCGKCSHKWSVAIPLGDCKKRREILGLIRLESEFYEKRDELIEIIERLHERA